MPSIPSPSLPALIADTLAIEAESAQTAGALGFLARAMVQATLPHKKVAGNEFERKNGAYTLHLLAPAKVGLPYGTVPRLLLAWLTTEAVRTQNRELFLGDSLSHFMHELDMVPTGGRWGSIKRLKDQTARLFASDTGTHQRSGKAEKGKERKVASAETSTINCLWGGSDVAETRAVACFPAVSYF